MHRSDVSFKCLLQLVLHRLGGGNFYSKIVKVSVLLRKRLLLKVSLSRLIFFLVFILFVLSVLHPNAHFKLHLNPPMEDKDIEVEHLLKEQSVVAMHHGMRVSDPSL